MLAARICAKFRFHRDAVLAAYLMMALAPTPLASAMPDLQITVKFTTPKFPERSRETKTYVQNDRKRVEESERQPQSLRPPGRAGPVVYAPAPRIVTITRCDLDQIFVLNLDDREYMSMPVPKPPTREELQARAQQAQKAQQPNPSKPATPPPTELIERITNDSGERKQMFGYTARHVITTQKQTPPIETGQPPQENVTDGWYADIDTSVPCDRHAGMFAFVSALSIISKKGEPPVIPVTTFKAIGNLEQGFALMTKERFRNAASPGLPAQDFESSESQVTELSTQPLDPALFEVPKNFRKVSQIRRHPEVPYWMQALGWLNYYWNYYWVRLKRAM